MPGSVVIGQPDFVSNTKNQCNCNTPAANTFRRPYQLIMVGSKLVVSDEDNHRILIFNSVPTSNNASADVVIGQPDFVSGSANQGASNPSANTINLPTDLFTDGTKLFVADYSNRRVLIFNSLPTTNNASADIVIGQTSMTTNTSGTTASTFKTPTSVFFDSSSKKLFIADEANNRVFIYNQVPTANGASADVVLGQADFTSGSANRGGSAAANTLSSPYGVRVYNGKLFVADPVNNRVLIWNSIPTTNGASADVVIGQKNFTSTSANQGGSPNANTLNLPYNYPVSIGSRLVIGDLSNNRVLIYDNIPTQNNASADIVIGQTNFTSNSANQGKSVGANTLNDAVGLMSSGNKLFVADRSNHRLLIFSNDLPDTKLTNTLVSGIANGRQKFKGTASTNVVNGVVRYVEYSINGSTWTGATPTDGQFNDATEDYSFDFDPKTNNPDTGKNVGFVVRVRNTHNNTVDSGSSAVYFEPFVVNRPLEKTYSSSSLPTFFFSINSWRFEDLGKDLDSFRVSINKDNQGWIPYIEDIPLSYEKVRDSSDNKRRSVVASSGNGVYEDKRKIVTYTSNNGTIDVQAKAVNRATGDSSDKDFLNGGFLLPKGSYQWRVEALDRAGHTQATQERTLFVGTSRQIVTSRSWFPLTIDSFTEVGTNLDWSSIHPQDIPQSVTSFFPQPTIQGIAMSGSTVTLSLTNKICVARGNTNCTISSQTITGDNSRYVLTSPPLLSGNDYTLTLSVADTGGNYNQLPEIQLQAGE